MGDAPCQTPTLPPGPSAPACQRAACPLLWPASSFPLARGMGLPNLPGPREESGWSENAAEQWAGHAPEWGGVCRRMGFTEEHGSRGDGVLGEGGSQVHPEGGRGPGGKPPRPCLREWDISGPGDPTDQGSAW